MSLRGMVGAIALLAAIGLVLAMTFPGDQRVRHVTARQDVASTPEASPPASPVASVALPGTPAADLPAVTGLAPTPPGPDLAQPTYENSTIGLILQFLPGWTYIESADRTGVAFYPPGSDPNTPSALIAFDLLLARPFEPAAIPAGDLTTPQPVTVGGISGIAYEDAAFTIPTQAYVIELPHRGGTLVITATKGPTVNLVPSLEQMLSTIALQP